MGSSSQPAGKRKVDLEVAAKSSGGSACIYVLNILA